MASAICRIIASSTLQPKVFQLFQPICGVFAIPSNFCAAAGRDRQAASANSARRADRGRFKDVLHRVAAEGGAGVSISAHATSQRACRMKSSDRPGAVTE